MRRYCLFGCAPSTHNMGVSALYRSAAAGVAAYDPGAEVCVFDFRRGVGEVETLRVGPVEANVRLVGANRSRRWHRGDSLARMKLSAAMGGVGNPAVALLKSSVAALDLSAGDSFTDLYGPDRFAAILDLKHLAMRVGTPLVLLPQTYGPFEADAARRKARRVVEASAMAWARDEDSFEKLRDLVGPSFDPERHRCGVDLAFRLPAGDLPDAVPAAIRGWLDDRDRPPVGFNVSGLVYNEPDVAQRQFGLEADYVELVHRFLGRLLAETDERLLLVPHVLNPAGERESDPGACEAVRSALIAADPRAAERVAVLPTIPDPSLLKAVIARCGWFCGTRMHSTIAALSSGVPAASVSYSLKTRGVFETCGVGEAVVDPRELDTDAAIASLWSVFESRDRLGDRLREELPGVKAQADGQMRDIVRRFSAAAA